MALKLSPLRKASALMAVLLVSLSGYWLYTSSQTIKYARLEEFADGVSFTEQMRLRVKDIRIGETSVIDLFRNPEQREPTWWEYYTLKKREITLALIRRTDVEELGRRLAERHADRLRVILHDDRDTIWKSIWGLRSEDRYNKVVDIVITMPCDEITRIIYQSINSIIKAKIQEEGKTDKRIDLNEVFDLLLRDQIEPYIASLDATKRDDPCFKTFQLLKWLRGEEASGFDFAQYRINDGLKGLLDQVAYALIEGKSAWALHNLTVKVVGYTDPVRVTKEGIPLQKEKTGIDDWSKVENPLDVYYSACIGDRSAGGDPIYIALARPIGDRIRVQIRNNCELGAARAYVGSVYLMNRLGRSGIEYSYATGGIYPNSGNTADLKKRRINIELTVKAAKANN
jgi:hypothetical protein